MPFPRDLKSLPLLVTLAALGGTGPAHDTPMAGAASACVSNAAKWNHAETEKPVSATKAARA